MTSKSGTKIVNNKIVNALLEAIFDVLDKDGLKSIINYANLQYMSNKLPSDGEIPYSDFLKLVDSMNFLLAYSKKVMFEIGRKFSFYLSPFGTHMLEFVQIIQETMVDEMDVEILYPSEEIVEVRLKNCPFCKSISSSMDSSQKLGMQCEFFKGLFWETVKKSSKKQNAEVEIEHILHNSIECYFVLKINKPNDS